MRRDVGGHAHGDAAGAVDQQVGKARRQHHRLALGVVVIVLEIDGLLVDVLEQLVGHLGEAHLGVAHGRRRIAVDRAEIALAVDERQAHGKLLRHAHQRVVDRLVAVGVIFTDDVADDARRLAVRLVPVIAVLLHRVEDAPMHGLEPVAHVGKRARHDHAHGVIEIGALHLIDERDGSDVRGDRALDLCLVVVSQGRRKPVLRGERTHAPGGGAAKACHAQDRKRWP